MVTMETKMDKLNKDGYIFVTWQHHICDSCVALLRQLLNEISLTGSDLFLSSAIRVRLTFELHS